MPFGVELPDDLGKETTEAPEATETNTDLTLEAGAKKADLPKTTPELADLDKLESFRFNGRDWTPKELKSAYMAQQDYTKKTTELAETRKYVDNFPSDLKTVLQDPTRLEEFKRVYPKDFVLAAERALQNLRSNPNAPQTTPKPDDELSKTVAEIKSDLSEWKQAQHKAEVQKIQSWLDNTYESLSKTYPYANHDAVSARAEVMSNQGNKITKEVLEKLFKQNDGEIKTRFEELYKEKVNKQLSTASKGKETGSGGGVPAQAPRGFKTIKEATKAFLEDVAN